MTTEEVTDKIEEIVDNVRFDGYNSNWWKKSGKENFTKAAHGMYKIGMSFGEIEKTLTDLFWAAAEEFGG